MMVLVICGTEGDGSDKRTQAIEKVLRDYGFKIQARIFETHVSPAEYEKMRHDIEKILGKDDFARFYIMGKGWRKRLSIVGKPTVRDPDGPFIF